MSPGGCIQSTSARVALCVFSFFLFSSDLISQVHQDRGAGFVEREILVKFKGGVKGQGAERARHALGHTVKRSFERVGWQHVRIPAGQTVEAAVRRYRAHPDVIHAEPNYLFRLPLRSEETDLIPDDELFDTQWELERIGVTNAWALTKGSSNVVVAVLDSGIRYTHEDLASRMWRNPGEIPDNGIDDDSNGYVDDVFGIDAVSQDSDPNDQPVGLVYHGTACASIIGAATDNEVGVSGVNWGVQLMALRLAAASNHIASAWVVECFDYVVMMKQRGINIRVTNNSYGIDDTPSLAVRDSIALAGQLGVLNVFAAGNLSRNVDEECEYPACFNLPEMINVAASDQSDQLAEFSNFGTTNVHLAAPGVDISTVNGISSTSYQQNFTGTSASCPLVAGGAALMAAAYPHATAAQLKEALLGSVDLSPAFADTTSSGGRLNLGRALFHPALAATSPPYILEAFSDQTVGVGFPLNLCVRSTGADPVDYRWMREGVLVAVTSEPAFLVPSASAGDIGIYTVVLSNAFGVVTSDSFSIDVVTEPGFLSPPQSLVVADGDTVTLEAEPVGAAPLTLQWLFEGEPVPGATERSLTLEGVGSSNSGNYQLVASNSFGQETSEPGILTVLTFAHIVEQPMSQTVAVGSDVSVRIGVTNSATLPIGYRWFRNRFPANLMVLEQTFAETNFVNIQTADAASWFVLVTNAVPDGAGAVISQTAYITVVDPPIDQQVQLGEGAEFSVNAVGPPPISLQWKFEGVELPDETGAGLSIENVQLGQAGRYSVVVFNAVGEPTEFAAHLQVGLPAPRLIEPELLPGGGVEWGAVVTVGADYFFERSTNLVHWRVLNSFRATDSVMRIRDAEVEAPFVRFYRLRSDW